MIARKYKKWKRTPTHLERLRMAGAKVSPKSKFLTLFFCVFFGIFGCHRLYLGKIISGLLMFIPSASYTIFMILGGFMFFKGKAEGLLLILVNIYFYMFILIIFVTWIFIDFIWILFIGMKDGKGRAVKDW